MLCFVVVILFNILSNSISNIIADWIQDGGRYYFWFVREQDWFQQTNFGISEMSHTHTNVFLMTQQGAILSQLKVQPFKSLGCGLVVRDLNGIFEVLDLNLLADNVPKKVQIFVYIESWNKIPSSPMYDQHQLYSI